MSHLRITNQREAIMGFLNRENHHPTASEIYKHVKLQLPRISRATVYRNLEVLCKEKVLRQVLVRGTSRFESVEHNGMHDHFICNRCNKIIDLEAKKSIEGLKNQLPDARIDNVTLNITGMCSTCLKGG